LHEKKIAIALNILYITEIKIDYEKKIIIYLLPSGSFAG
jgi:hypothetical protein